jgi:hypothetical protein
VPSQIDAFGHEDLWMGLTTSPTTWETGMIKKDEPMSQLHPLGLGRNQGTRDLAERLAGHIEEKARGRIRDLHVVCSDDMIILQGRSRTYHAKQLAQQAVLDLTDGQTLLTNQIVVC